MFTRLVIACVTQCLRFRKNWLQNVIVRCIIIGLVQDVKKWLPKSEDRLRKMAPPAADVRPVRIQLEELKVC